MTELAAGLSKAHKVSVVTSRNLLADVEACLPRFESLGAVGIFRLRASQLGRSSLWRRALDQLSFHASVLLFLLRKVRRDDIVVLMTDPPLLQLLNGSAVRVKRGVVVNWIQDLYPEIAFRLGKFPAPRWLYEILVRWRNRALRSAAANAVVSRRMAGYLASNNIKNTRVIFNWADGGKIEPLDHNANTLRSAWGLTDKFVVMYSGNFGQVHAFEDILLLARELAGEPDIYFVFVGQGARLEPLLKALSDSGVKNFSFKPHQPRAALRQALNAADLHLVTLKEGMEELVMPSKLYGALAVGRPVAFIGEPESEIARLIDEEQVGISCGSGDGSNLAARIVELKENPLQRSTFQRNARNLFERQFDLSIGVVGWQRLIDETKFQTHSQDCQLSN